MPFHDSQMFIQIDEDVKLDVLKGKIKYIGELGSNLVLDILAFFLK